MRILDLTLTVNTDSEQSVYSFNPSITVWGNWYLITYRIITSNTHPWMLWNQCSSNYLPNGQDNTQIAKHIYNCLDHDRFINADLPGQSSPIDTTALMILDQEFNLIQNYKNVFTHHMVHDTRLYHSHENIFWISYNAFLSGHTHMLKRELELFLTDDDEPDCIFLGPENYILKQYNSVEKNCILIDELNVLYSIDGETVVESNGKRSYISSTILSELKMRYPQITLSLGTPLVKFDQYLLGVGHAKMPIQHINKYNLGSISNMTLHGKYIYLAFLYLLDPQSYRCVAVSDMFIPSSNSNHMPYTLVFPTGLCQSLDGSYLISYGEGDVRCKLLILADSEIRSLMKITDHKIILLEDIIIRQPIVAHIGYYNHWNVGDEAFRVVFEQFATQLGYKAQFGDFSEFNTYFFQTAAVLGGGDVVNKYFMQRYFKLNMNAAKHIAFGVGIPNLDDMYYLSMFESAYLRNSRDVEMIKSICPSVTSIPDLAWCLLQSGKFTPHTTTATIRNIGLSISRMEFQYKKHDTVTRKRFLDLARSIRTLTVHYNVYYIPFCIDDNNTNEDDRILGGHLCQMVPKLNMIHFSHDSNFVTNVIQSVGNMDLMICGRFHSHIFSAMMNVPFLSISSTRKCTEIIQEWSMQQYSVSPDNLLPVIQSLNLNQLTSQVSSIRNTNIQSSTKIIDIWKSELNL